LPTIEHSIEPSRSPIDVFAKSIDVSKEHLSLGAWHEIAAFMSKVFRRVAHRCA
jgi:hypothetical protein